MKVIILKQTKFVKVVRFLWLLGFVIFFAAIVTQVFNIQTCSILYIVGFCIYVIAAILSEIAAKKDKEHLKEYRIGKKDERIKNITILSKAKAFDIFTIIFSLVLIFSASLKMIDMKTCIIFGILCLLPIILQVYYFFNFSKKM